MKVHPIFCKVVLKEQSAFYFINTVKLIIWTHPFYSFFNLYFTVWQEPRLLSAAPCQMIKHLLLRPECAVFTGRLFIYCLVYGCRRVFPRVGPLSLSAETFLSSRRVLFLVAMGGAHTPRRLRLSPPPTVCSSMLTSGAAVPHSSALTDAIGT